MIAELSIKTVAFFSFAVIVLIFLFVFRESTPLFFQDEQSISPTNEISSPQLEEQETYGEDPSASSDIQHDKTKSSDVETEGSEEKVTAKNLLGSEWQPVSSKPKFGFLPLMEIGRAHV